MNKHIIPGGPASQHSLRRLLPVLAVMACLIFSGCAELFSRAIGGPESPRPNKPQLESVISINQTNVPVIAGLQEDKQKRLETIALRAIELLPQCKTPEQVEALTNIVANALESVKEADGTAKILGNFSGKTITDIARMPLGEYLAYTAGQSIVASRNQELALEGIKVGWQWTVGKIAGAGGLFALFATMGSWGGINLFKKRKAQYTSKALVKGVDRVKAKFPDQAEEINYELAREAAKAPVDVNAEVERLRKS